MTSCDLALTPDVYSPQLGTNGEYCDRLPIFGTHTPAYSCPCTLTGRSYRRGALATHFKTRRHVHWLANMNANRHNHLVQYVEAQATVRSQTRMIATLQKDVDITKQRLAGMSQVVSSRDARIAELETELILLRAPPQESPNVVQGRYGRTNNEGHAGEEGWNEGHTVHTVHTVGTDWWQANTARTSQTAADPRNDKCWTGTEGNAR